jgi:hypothetical protein
MSNERFKEGDIIVSMNGKRPAVVSSTHYYGSYGGGYVYAKYLHNGSSIRFDANNVKLYEDGNMADAKTLYSLTKEDGTVVYGTHVGTNSQNKLLIEIKGTNEIVLADKNQLEEVIPYTFSVRMNGKNTHYQCEPGKFKKNDVLLYTGAGADKFEVAMVTAVDTKNKGATIAFKGLKLVTEEI